MSVLGCGLIYAAAVLVANRQGLTTDDTAFTLLLVPACLLLGIGAGIDRIVGDRDRPEGMLFGLLTASTRHSLALATPCLIAAAVIFIASVTV